MIGLTDAEGTMLVRAEVGRVEVRFWRAEERTGSRETDGAGGAEVGTGATKVLFAGP